MQARDTLVHLVQVKTCVSFILWVRWSSNFDIAKGTVDLRIEYFAKAAAYKEQKSFNHSGPKSKTRVFPRCPIFDLSEVSLCIFGPFCVFNV